MRRQFRSVRALVGASTLALASVALPLAHSAEAVQPRLRVAGATTIPRGATILAGTHVAAFDLVLASKDAAGESTFLRQLTTVGSPEYHHFLSPRQFADRFGAPTSAVSALTSYLASHGLHVGNLSKGRLVLRVQGQTSVVASTFHARLATIRRSDGTVVSQFTSPATLPASLAHDVVGIEGLSRTTPLSSFLVRPRGTTTGSSGYAGACSKAGASSGTTPNNNQGYTVQQQGQVYGLTSSWLNGDTGKGAVIAMYELGTFDAADAKVFFTCYHLSPTINTIKVDGGATGSFSDEATMDVEEAAALAPGATIDIYSGPNSGNGPVDVYTRIADDNKATIVSVSWGDCETDPTGAVAAEQPLFEQMAAEGMTVVAAAGDSGSSDCNGITTNAPAVDDPASQPFVTGVGGLTLNDIAPINQSVWNNNGGASGGGISTLWSRPWWQTGGVLAHDTAQGVAGATHRMVPDLSVMGDPNTGFIQYFTGTNKATVICGHNSCSGWGSIGGTSIGAPLVSATFAIASQTCGGVRLGFLNPTLYSIASAGGNYLDVTAGNNDLFNQGVYAAGTGYDLASGLGSPTGNFVNDLCPATVNASKSALRAAPAPHIVNANITITATVRDAQGAPLANAPVDFVAHTDGGASTLSFDNLGTSTTSPNHATLEVRSSSTGIATVTLSSTNATPVTIAATVNGQPLSSVVLNFASIPLTRQVPLQPVVRTVAPSATSVNVALASHHGATPPVKFFQVSVDGGRTWLTFTGRATTFVVHNLAPRHHYTLVVRARNANGTSPVSLPHSVVTLA